AMRLRRQRAMRRRTPRLALERAFGGPPTAPRRRPRLALVLADLVVALGRLPRATVSAARRLQGDARAPRLRQADRDRLLGRARAVLAAADVIHLLVNELACRGRRRATGAELFLGLA